MHKIVSEKAHEQECQKGSKSCRPTVEHILSNVVLE